MSESVSNARPAEPSVEIEAHYGQCPVQIFGRVDGARFYFRMRGGIRFSAAYGQSPIEDGAGITIDCEAYPSIGDPLDDLSGPRAWPGYASKEVALDVLARCIAIYRDEYAL